MTVVALRPECDLTDTVVDTKIALRRFVCRYQHLSVQ